MSLTIKYKLHYTIKYYEKWQGDWELVEGIPYALASSGFIHQRTIIKIVSKIDPYLAEYCNACHVAVDVDWIIGEDTVLRPDIIIFCHEPEQKLRKTPEIIFEVVSDSPSFMDEGLKFELYEREGVNYYIPVYPEKRGQRYIPLRISAT